ncbi:hypothetical protein IX51_06030 [uncultured archaeon]|nr:hypothetical protein IX51_06030 [uncultured archaeon]
MLCDKQELENGSVKPIFIEVKSNGRVKKIWEDICSKKTDFELVMEDQKKREQLFSHNRLHWLYGKQYVKGSSEFVVFSYSDLFDDLTSVLKLTLDQSNGIDARVSDENFSLPKCKTILWGINIAQGISNYRIKYAYGNLSGISKWTNCSESSNNFCVNDSERLKRWLINGSQHIESTFRLSKPEVVDRYVNIILLMKTSDFFLSPSSQFTKSTAISAIIGAFENDEVTVSQEYAEELFGIMEDSNLVTRQQGGIGTYKVRNDIKKLIDNLNSIKPDEMPDPVDKKKANLLMHLSKHKHNTRKKSKKESNTIQHDLLSNYDN